MEWGVGGRNVRGDAKNSDLGNEIGVAYPMEWNKKVSKQHESLSFNLLTRQCNWWNTSSPTRYFGCPSRDKLNVLFGSVVA